jgi:hypothetical protein
MIIGSFSSREYGCKHAPTHKRLGPRKTKMAFSPVMPAGIQLFYGFSGFRLLGELRPSYLSIPLLTKTAGGRMMSSSVIPAKAGIQVLRALAECLDPGDLVPAKAGNRGDDFFEAVNVGSLVLWIFQLRETNSLKLLA